MSERWATTHAGFTVLLDQRINKQSAIQAPVPYHAQRKLRLPFFDHQSLAFFTGHVALLIVGPYPSRGKLAPFD
jgi:hypothetical protein